MAGIDTYTIEWPPKPPTRPRWVWAHFTRGHHSTFKETRKGRKRSDERRFVGGGDSDVRGVCDFRYDGSGLPQPPVPTAYQGVHQQNQFTLG